MIPRDTDRQIDHRDLLRQHGGTIHLAASQLVAATVQGDDLDAIRPSLGELVDVLVAGVFVTLQREGTLRGCCGLHGTETPLFDALSAASRRTAQEDPRMIPISAEELFQLQLSVSILGPSRSLPFGDEARVGAIEIGRHGLRIRMGSAAGLLLPSVASEREWTPHQFLEAVCRKAGLSTAAWRSEHAVVELFDGGCVSGPISNLSRDDGSPLS